MEKTYYLNREQYNAVKDHWKTKSSHRAWEHVVYNVLRDKDPKNGFHEKKSNIQGNDPWHGFKFALSQAKWYIKPFPGMTTFDFKAHFGIDLPEGLREKL